MEPDSDSFHFTRDVLDFLWETLCTLRDWSILPIRILWPFLLRKNEYLTEEELDLEFNVNNDLVYNDNDNNDNDLVQDPPTKPDDQDKVNTLMDVVESFNGGALVKLRSKPLISFVMDTSKYEKKLCAGDWIVVKYIEKAGSFDAEIKGYDYLRKKSFLNTCFTYIDVAERKAVINNKAIYYFADTDTFTPSYHHQVFCHAIEHEHGIFPWRAIYVKQTEFPAPRCGRYNTIFIGDTLEFNAPLNQSRTISVLMENSKKVPVVLDSVSFDGNKGVLCCPNFHVPMTVPAGTKKSLTFSVTGTLPGVHTIRAKYVFGRISFLKSWKAIFNDGSSPIDSIPTTLIPSGYRLRSPYSGRTFKAHTLPKVFLEAEIDGRSDSPALDRIKDLYPEVNGNVDGTCYTKFFDCLLFLEEAKEEQLFKELTFLAPVLAPEKGLHFKIRLPSEVNCSFLAIGHKVRIVEVWEKHLVFEGTIRDRTWDEIYVTFSPEFRHYHTPSLMYHVTFAPSKTTYAKMHHAISAVFNEFGPRWLFPMPPQDRCLLKPDGLLKTKEYYKTMFYNKQLNNYQQEAVYNAINCASTHPYLIFGPPGSGKTVTLIEIILQIINSDPSSRILVATPTNNSIDVICSKLIKNPLAKKSLVRLASYVYLRSGKLPDHLESISYLPVGGESMELHETDPDIKQMLLSQIIRHRIICGTLETIANLYILGLSKDHITHIIIDEAAQSTEPRTLCPVSLVHRSAKLILVGDHLQLGPILASKAAGDFGLSISLMERLMGLPAYSSSSMDKSWKQKYDPKYVTQLRVNYRSDAQIVEFLSNMFYSNTLIPIYSPPVADEEVSRIVQKTIKSVSGIQTSSSIFFHGTCGTATRDTASLSLCNDAEILVISQYYFQLWSHGLREEDVGIITPYSFQVRRLTKFFREIQVIPPKIGSVEEFQGDERKVILLSTVNTNNPTPFLTSQKRINVALSRSQYATIIVGNIEALAKNITWSNVIDYCTNQKAILKN